MQRSARASLLIAALALGCGGAQKPPPPAPAATSEPAPSKPSPTPAPAVGDCPPEILKALGETGACLEAKVLGDAAVTACGAYLENKGWKRDADAETHVGKETGKTLICYVAPAAAHP